MGIPATTEAHIYEIAKTINYNLLHKAPSFAGIKGKSGAQVATRTIKDYEQKLLKAANCECLKVWVYVLLYIPSFGVKGAVKLVANRAVGRGAARAKAAMTKAWDAEMKDGVHKDELSKDLAANALRGLQYGACPPHKCPVPEELLPNLRNVIPPGSAQQSMTFSSAKTRDGIMTFRDQACWVVEGISPRDLAPVSIPGGSVEFGGKFYMLVRFIFCFYQREPAPPPTSPKDPGVPAPPPPTTPGDPGNPAPPTPDEPSVPPSPGGRRTYASAEPGAIGADGHNYSDVDWGEHQIAFVESTPAAFWSPSDVQHGSKLARAWDSRASLPAWS